MSTPADLSGIQETSPAQALLRLISGNYISRAIYAVAKLGIADLLRDGPQRSDMLAQATDTDARALYRVLRTLASVGVFVEDRVRRRRGRALWADAAGSLSADWRARLIAGLGDLHGSGVSCMGRGAL